MSGISIKFSGVTLLAPITVRVTGGAFLSPPGNGFATSGNLHSVAVTGDALRFSPAAIAPFTGTLSIGLSAAAGNEPVIEIDQEGQMSGPVQAATQASQAASAFEQALGGLSPHAAATAAQVVALREAGLNADMALPSPPRTPGPQGTQAITVTWPTAAGPRSQAIAIRTPLTLAGFTG